MAIRALFNPLPPNVGGAGAPAAPFAASQTTTLQLDQITIIAGQADPTVEGGDVIYNGNLIGEKNRVVELRAEAKPGFVFKGWTIDREDPAPELASVTFNNVTGGGNYVVEYIDPDTDTYVSVNNPPKIITYLNSVFTISAIPDISYLFDKFESYGGDNQRWYVVVQPDWSPTADGGQYVDIIKIYFKAPVFSPTAGAPTASPLSPVAPVRACVPEEEQCIAAVDKCCGGAAYQCVNVNNIGIGICRSTFD